MLSKANQKAIASAIFEATQERFSVQSCVPVSGGDINQAYILGDHQVEYFVKLNRADRLPLFQTEAAGLNALSQSGEIKVPKVITCGIASQSYLVLEKLNLSSVTTVESFARRLASHHLVAISPDRRFGFHQDNFIGLTPQQNAWSDDWPAFFLVRRIMPQCKLLKQRFSCAGLLNQVGRLKSKVDEIFAGYQPQPSLVHGDLWQGNWGITDRGEPVIYDPACYYGDHEVDLAMLELFGSPGPAFFSAYHKVFPIDAGYPRRRVLYNLYHLLNHANLFGGHYLKQAETTLARLLD